MTANKEALELTVSGDRLLKTVNRYRRGRRLFVSCTLFLPSAENLGFNLPMNIPVTYPALVRVVSNLADFSTRKAEKGEACNVRLVVYDNSIFIG